MDPAFLRARVSQRYGADLAGEARAGAAARTGDADLPGCMMSRFAERSQCACSSTCCDVL